MMVPVLDGRAYAADYHRIAKSIVAAHPHTLIGVEELTGIRERTKRRKRRRKKNGQGTAPVSPKARRANRHASQWAFAELHDLLTYKATLAGSLAIKVDADYTSQACPLCGYTDRHNRPRNGLLFVCQNGCLVSTRLLCRTVKPKRHASAGMPNCGGVRTRAPPVKVG